MQHLKEVGSGVACTEDVRRVPVLGLSGFPELREEPVPQALMDGLLPSAATAASRKSSKSAESSDKDVVVGSEGMTGGVSWGEWAVAGDGTGVSSPPGGAGSAAWWTTLSDWVQRVRAT